MGGLYGAGDHLEKMAMEHTYLKPFVSKKLRVLPKALELLANKVIKRDIFENLDSLANLDSFAILTILNPRRSELNGIIAIKSRMLDFINSIFLLLNKNRPK